MSHAPKQSPALPGSLLIFGTWVAAFSWRPWLLGFYHDDWSTLGSSALIGKRFSLERLEFLLSAFPSRPMAGLINFLLLSLFGGRPFVWQVIIALGVLAVSLSLYRFLSALGQSINFSETQQSSVSPFYSLSAAFCSMLWMIIPWNMGTTTWPDMNHGLFATVMFLESARLLILNPAPKRYVFLAGFLSFLGFMAYEAYYFQFALIILVVAILGGKYILAKQVRWILAFAFSQTVAIAWNRYSITLLGGASKLLNPNWKESFLWSLQNLNHSVFESSMQSYYSEILCSVCGFAALAVLSGIQSTIKERSFLFLRVVLAIASLISGVVLVVLLHSAVGYGMSGVGIMSRTTLGMNIVMPTALFLMMVLAAAAPIWQSIIRVTLMLLCLSTYIEIGTSYFIALQDWITSWSIQKHILENAPVQKLEQLAPGTTVVVYAPDSVNAVPVFQAFWDINSAMVCTFPGLRANFIHALGDEKSLFTAGRPGIFSSRFDGAILSQSWASSEHSTIWKFHSRHVVLWNTLDNSIREVRAGEVL